MRRTRALEGIARQRRGGTLRPARKVAARAKGARDRADDAARVARRDGLRFSQAPANTDWLGTLIRLLPMEPEDQVMPHALRRMRALHALNAARLLVRRPRGAGFEPPHERRR